MKKDAAVTASFWRADLWSDPAAAIEWANTPPLSQAGTITFDVQDNGQVWTFTLI